MIFDRFEKSAESRPQGDPDDPESRHGGTINGLISRLDYLQGMGMTTLVVSPLHMVPPDQTLGYYAYHGYWPVHFFAVDPHLGTMDDFKELVRQAHARGMRIVLDFVVNHAGPVFTYEGNPAWESMQGPPKQIEAWQYPVWPEELRHARHFQRRGPIADWEDSEQRLFGDFPPDLRKLDLSRPETQNILIHAVKWWIKETDIDGIRLDTYQHVTPAFWRRFHREVREYSARLGKRNFFHLGEVYHGDPNIVDREVGPDKLDSAYNYPAYFWDMEVFRGRAPTGALERSLNSVVETFGENAKRLVRFLDNQDKPRFLRPGNPTGLLRVALAYLMFSIGIPFVYYGTEQALRAVDDGDRGYGTVREDMFLVGFDTEAPLYRFISKLAELRKRYVSLSRGGQWVRFSEAAGGSAAAPGGIYAFSRIHRGEEVLVVLNMAEVERAAGMWIDRNLSPPGVDLVDILDPSYSVRPYGALSENGTPRRAGEGEEAQGSGVEVSVPPYGVRILVRRSADPGEKAP